MRQGTPALRLVVAGSRERRRKAASCTLKPRHCSLALAVAWQYQNRDKHKPPPQTTPTYSSASVMSLRSRGNARIENKVSFFLPPHTTQSHSLAPALSLQLHSHATPDHKASLPPSQTPSPSILTPALSPRTQGNIASETSPSAVLGVSSVRHPTTPHSQCSDRGSLAECR